MAWRVVIGLEYNMVTGLEKVEWAWRMVTYLGDGEWFWG